MTISLDQYIDSLYRELRGLGQVPTFGWGNPLNLLKRRRESYLLGELRGATTARDLLKERSRK